MSATRDITNAVKLSGPNPDLNPRLHLAIATAKKNAVPKASIEAAIARGQVSQPRVLPSKILHSKLCSHRRSPP